MSCQSVQARHRAYVVVSNHSFATTAQATALRHRALSTLFGLDQTHLVTWPGLDVFFDHLEHCFQGLLASRFQCIWKLLGRAVPGTPDVVWHWCFAVLDAYESTQEKDPSIEGIYNQLCVTAGRNTPEGENTNLPKEEDRSNILQAMFAVLCWTSATLVPVLGGAIDLRPLPDLESEASSDGEASSPLTHTALIAENSSRAYSSTADDLRRPTSKMFNQYKTPSQGTRLRTSRYGVSRDRSSTPRKQFRGHALCVSGQLFFALYYRPC